MLDQQRVSQVLINLISNAVKFSIEGETIFLQASTTLELGTQHIELQVIDTGLGMD